MPLYTTEMDWKQRNPNVTELQIWTFDKKKKKNCISLLVLILNTWIQSMKTWMSLKMSFQPSMVISFSEVQSWWQQAKPGTPDILRDGAGDSRLCVSVHSDKLSALPYNQNLSDQRWAHEHQSYISWWLISIIHHLICWYCDHFGSQSETL